NWAVLMDSDIGDPMQHSRNVKKIEEIRTSGKLGFLTKKREPENYIDPQIIMDEYEIVVEYSEEDDAKKIIATATTTRKDDVLEKFWPKMTAEMILSQSKYIDDGAGRYEIQEILSDVLSLC
ncbi:MAG: hypothetical protein MI799_14275, partial [Desulfobacterales bacterium]|nr:hypothetical protein [Desulfobacterales bacterium]